MRYKKKIKERICIYDDKLNDCKLRGHTCGKRYLKHDMQKIQWEFGVFLVFILWSEKEMVVVAAAAVANNNYIIVLQ